MIVFLLLTISSQNKDYHTLITVLYFLSLTRLLMNPVLFNFECNKLGKLIKTGSTRLLEADGSGHLAESSMFNEHSHAMNHG